MLRSFSYGARLGAGRPQRALLAADTTSSWIPATPVPAASMSQCPRRNAFFEQRLWKGSAYGNNLERGSGNGQFV